VAQPGRDERVVHVAGHRRVVAEHHPTQQRRLGGREMSIEDALRPPPDAVDHAERAAATATGRGERGGAQRRVRVHRAAGEVGWTERAADAEEVADAERVGRGATRRAVDTEEVADVERVGRGATRRAADAERVGRGATRRGATARDRRRAAGGGARGGLVAGAVHQPRRDAQQHRLAAPADERATAAVGVGAQRREQRRLAVHRLAEGRREVRALERGGPRVGDPRGGEQDGGERERRGRAADDGHGQRAEGDEQRGDGDDGGGRADAEEEAGDRDGEDELSRVA